MTSSSHDAWSLALRRSWVAPPSDVHSQQRFYYQAHSGDLSVDQARRGYSGSTEEGGYASLNPLYMRYTPDTEGKFAGRDGYGYKSLESFVSACRRVNDGSADVSALSHLPTIEDMRPTAILEACRLSLDSKGLPCDIVYDAHGDPESVNVRN